MLKPQAIGLTLKNNELLVRIPVKHDEYTDNILKQYLELSNRNDYFKLLSASDASCVYAQLSFF